MSSYDGGSTLGVKLDTADFSEQIEKLKTAAEEGLKSVVPLINGVTEAAAKSAGRVRDLLGEASAVGESIASSARDLSEKTGGVLESFFRGAEEFGKTGAARLTESVSNVVKSGGSALSSFGESVGKISVEAGSLAETLASGVSGAAKGVTDALSSAASPVKDFLNDIGEKARGGLKGIMDGLTGPLEEFASGGLSGLLSGIAGKDGFGGLVNGLIGNVQNAISGITGKEGIGGIAASVQNILSGITGKDGFGGLVNGLIGNIQNAISGITGKEGIGGAVSGFFGGIGDAVSGFFTKGEELPLSEVREGIESITDAVTKGSGALKTFGETAAEGVKNVAPAVSEAANGVMTVFDGIGGWIKNIGSSFMGFVGGMFGKGSKIGGFFSGLFGGDKEEFPADSEAAGKESAASGHESSKGTPAGKPEGAEGILPDKKDVDETVGKTTDGLGIIGQGVAQLVGTLASGEDAFKNFGKTAVSIVANVVASFGQALIAAAPLQLIKGEYGKFAKSMAFGAMAIAAASALSSVAGSFAYGGIIPDMPGGAYGDKLIARVNSGEMVLNRDQQARLFAMASGNGPASSSGGVSVQVVNNAADMVSATPSLDDGKIKILIQQEVLKTISGPRGAELMGSRYGLRQQGTRRI